MKVSVGLWWINESACILFGSSLYWVFSILWQATLFQFWGKLSKGHSLAHTVSPICQCLSILEILLKNYIPLSNSAGYHKYSGGVLLRSDFKKQVTRFFEFLDLLVVTWVKRPLGALKRREKQTKGRQYSPRLLQSLYKSSRTDLPTQLYEWLRRLCPAHLSIHPGWSI